jgi:hypothetical protein
MVSGKVNRAGPRREEALWLQVEEAKNAAGRLFSPEGTAASSRGQPMPNRAHVDYAGVKVDYWCHSDGYPAF